MTTETPLLSTYGMSSFNKAYEIASMVHKDQRRKDGKPYMSHIDAVVIGTMEHVNAHSWGICDLEAFLIVAALHDAVEDHPDKVSFEMIEKEISELICSSSKMAGIMGALRAITKLPKGQQKYSDYIMGVAANPYSRIVKIADLTHNMSDLSPGNMRDKYDLSLWVLNNAVFVGNGFN